MGFSHHGPNDHMIDQQNDTHHKDQSHGSDFVKDTAVAIASIVGAFFIIAGNLGTLVSYGRCRRLQTIPNMYVYSLALADILVGLVLFMKGSLGFPAARVTLEHNQYFCLCLVSLIFTSVAASMFSSSLVACDRYMFIQYPLRYDSLVTRKVCLMCILGVWCIAVVYGFLPIYWSHFEQRDDCAPTHIFPYQYMIIIHPLVFFSLSIITFTFYAKIYRIALWHHSRINSQKRSVRPSVNSVSIGRRVGEKSEITNEEEGTFNSTAHSSENQPSENCTRTQKEQRPVVIHVKECQNPAERLTPDQIMAITQNVQNCYNKQQRQTSHDPDNSENGLHLHEEENMLSLEQQDQLESKNQHKTNNYRSCSQHDLSQTPQETVPRVSASSWKMIKAMVLTFGLFFLSWCPLLVVAYIEYTVHVSHLALSIAGMVGMLNSGKNCLVLLALDREFRRQFKLLLRCDICCSRADRVSPEPCNNNGDEQRATNQS